MNDKTGAYGHMIGVIMQSWTWDRLTEDERKRFMECLNSSKLFGTREQRISIIHGLYHAFLSALGCEPIGWREEESGNPLF